MSQDSLQLARPTRRDQPLARAIPRVDPAEQIIKLKQLLANKTLEVDFFRHALQRVGARRRQGDIPPENRAHAYFLLKCAPPIKH